jgi:Xaa-Pro aminopeptidase
MITKKTPEEIEILKEAGGILGRMLREIAAALKPGMTT